MFRIVFLLAAVVVVRASSTPDFRCSKMKARIIGGDKTDIKKVPWQISLIYDNEHDCGGAIYSKTLIITAAHCLKGRSASLLKVLAGSNSTRNGLLLDVKDFTFHEKYNSKTKDYDIGLIRLKKKLKFSENIKKIKLASTAPKNNAPALVCGWGRINSVEYASDLRCVCVNIIDNASCGSTAYDYGKTITPSMICADAPGKDSCDGDSGGPLVSGGVMVGVVSFGPEICGSPSQPGVYADVAHLKPWIEKNANKKNFGSHYYYFS